VACGRLATHRLSASRRMKSIDDVGICSLLEAHPLQTSMISTLAGSEWEARMSAAVDHHPPRVALEPGGLEGLRPDRRAGPGQEGRVGCSPSGERPGRKA